MGSGKEEEVAPHPYAETQKMLSKTPVRDQSCLARLGNGLAVGTAGGLLASWGYTSWTMTRGGGRWARWMASNKRFVPLAAAVGVVFPLVECNLQDFSHNNILNAGVAGACAGAVAGLPKGSIQATLGSSLICGVGLMLVEFAPRMSRRPIDESTRLHPKEQNPDDPVAWQQHSAKMDNSLRNLPTRV